MFYLREELKFTIYSPEYDFEIINKTFNYLTLIFKKNENIEVFKVINMYAILVS